MAVDIDALWDFGNPALSEERFTAALAGARPEDAFLLRTQIARTHGLRGNLARQREILAELEPSLTRVGAEARTRYYLEFGRSYASATHKPEQQTAETRQLASTAYKAAIGEAKAARLDGLLVDALHMMEFVESSQEAKLTWIREAIVVASSSTQEDARRWLAALRNNAGYTLHQMGRYQEALNEFEAALVLREAQGQPESIRIARWMVGWTLRSLGRIDEALAIQLRLERERNEASRPSPFVFAELSELYRERGEADKAEHYKQLKQRLESPK